MNYTYGKEAIMVTTEIAGMVFTDISSEESRTYIWPDGSTVVIIGPCWLNVSSYGHRLIDFAGTSHYVPMGWIHLYWTVKQGAPKFVM